ncbi:hypothetical protein OAJ42_00465 [Flavobacteriales bacterium]|nr:hypothetical protein [Flavobacteriales bacterium]
MGLGRTFTHSIAREIGRNFGKAASNYLLGDKHSTPIRMVGGNYLGRKRGKIYDNDFDKHIKKFEIKTAKSTFSQILNIHSSFFSLVDEAQADGTIDLIELAFLVKQIPRAISVSQKGAHAINDLGDPDLVKKVEDKITGFKEFMKSLNDALILDHLPKVRTSPLAILFLLLSVVGLDRIYFSPKKFTSYIIPVACFFTMGIYSFIYVFFVNPKSSYGYWGYRNGLKRQRANNQLAVDLKEFMTAEITKY